MDVPKALNTLKTVRTGLIESIAEHEHQKHPAANISVYSAANMLSDDLALLHTWFWRLVNKLVTKSRRLATTKNEQKLAPRSYKTFPQHKLLFILVLCSATQPKDSSAAWSTPMLRRGDNR